MSHPSPSALRLRLYVAGGARNSVLARDNLERLLQGASQAAEVEVVDVLSTPERALADGVLVTPTLIRLAPSPQRRIVGNLSDPRAVALALGLTPLGGAP